MDDTVSGRLPLLIQRVNFLARKLCKFVPQPNQFLPIKLRESFGFIQATGLKMLMKPPEIWVRNRAAIPGLPRFHEALEEPVNGEEKGLGRCDIDHVKL